MGFGYLGIKSAILLHIYFYIQKLMPVTYVL